MKTVSKKSVITLVLVLFMASMNGAQAQLNKKVTEAGYSGQTDPLFR